MKLVTSLLALMLALGPLSKLCANTELDAYSERVRTAVSEKSKEKLLACFNFEGINKEHHATVVKIVEDLLASKDFTVAVVSFDESKQKEWDQAKPDLNGRPMADISFSKKDGSDPKFYSMVAGATPKGFLILLSNHKINSEPK